MLRESSNLNNAEIVLDLTWVFMIEIGLSTYCHKNHIYIATAIRELNKYEWFKMFRQINDITATLRDSIMIANCIFIYYFLYNVENYFYTFVGKLLDALNVLGVKSRLICKRRLKNESLNSVKYNLWAFLQKDSIKELIVSQ